MALYGGIKIVNRPDPENIRHLDILQLPFLQKMMRFGMRIDVPYLNALSTKLQGRMKELKYLITSEIPADELYRFVDNSELEEETEEEDNRFQVGSTKKTVELLYDVLRLHTSGGVKVKKTKSGGLSTGKKTLEQLKRDHPIVDHILQYREYAKLDGTYAQSMPRRARFHPKGPDCPVCGRDHRADQWRVHTQIMTTRAVTGRTASKSPNLANIPARSALGREIRAAFICEEGYVFSQRDFAQIELRLMADQSGDEVMIQVYEADGDIHVETAMRTFNISDPSKIDKLFHRAPSKNTNFAVAYLITGSGLLDLMASTFATAGVPMPDYMNERWCDEFIEKWFGVYRGVRVYLDSQESIARRFGFVWTPTGRVRRIPEVRSYHAYIQSAGVRQGCNHGIQGYSADIMKLTMAELNERLERLEEYGVFCFPQQTIYDELLIECEEDDGETLQAVMSDVMDNVLTDKQTGKLCCRVPIKSDGHCMDRWKKD